MLYLSFKEEYFKIEEMVKVNLSEDIKYEQWKNDNKPCVCIICGEILVNELTILAQLDKAFAIHQE